MGSKVFKRDAGGSVRTVRVTADKHSVARSADDSRTGSLGFSRRPARNPEQAAKEIGESLLADGYEEAS